MIQNTSSDSANAPKIEGNGDAAARAHQLQMLAVVFVGALALVLAGGAIAITLFQPERANLVWPAIVGLLSTAITSLIWWSTKPRK